MFGDTIYIFFSCLKGLSDFVEFYSNYYLIGISKEFERLVKRLVKLREIYCTLM